MATQCERRRLQEFLILHATSSSLSSIYCIHSLLGDIQIWLTTQAKFKSFFPEFPMVTSEKLLFQDLQDDLL